MELAGKQQRLLKDLAAIDEYGGNLDARLEQSAKGDFFHLEGYKATQSDPMDLTYTIGADYLYELQKDGCLDLDPLGEGKYNLRITPRGLSTLRE